VKTQITPEPGRGIVLTDEMQRAAGMLPGQTLAVFIEPGEIRITRQQSTDIVKATIVQKGKIKILTGGPIPNVPIEQAVRMVRDEIR
jgi:hypothetical protein